MPSSISDAVRSPGSISRIRGQLDVTGERLDRARERFNEAVEAYNDTLGRFPQRFVAPLFDFRKRDPWHTRASSTPALPEEAP